MNQFLSSRPSYPIDRDTDWSNSHTTDRIEADHRRTRTVHIEADQSHTGGHDIHPHHIGEEDGTTTATRTTTTIAAARVVAIPILTWQHSRRRTTANLGRQFFDGAFL